MLGKGLPAHKRKVSMSQVSHGHMLRKVRREKKERKKEKVAVS